MGSIYLRGRVYWIAYRKNGKNIFESAKTNKKTVAAKLLTDREDAINKGREIITKHEKFDYLKKLILDDYKINGKKSEERLKISIGHLEKYFDGFKADQISTSDIKNYIAERLKEKEHPTTKRKYKPANGTINRELTALRRMLNLAAQDGKINRVPFFPMLKESAPRQGFFEHDEYLSILAALPVHLRPVVTFAYHTGWRKNEILNLTWDKVDLKERTVTLRAEDTKNQTARSIYLDDDLLTLLKLQNLKRGECSFVFNDKGEQIKDFRGSWKNACNDTKLSGKLFHDFRRTAARNLTRSGTQETVAMKITGHKTRSVFDRYNITSQEDIKKAVERQQKYLSNEVTTKIITVDENQQKDSSDSKAQVINISR